MKKAWAADPLNAISLAVFLVWGIVGIWFRPIGDFGVETDFYGDFVPHARQWMSGNPSLLSGYRGPFYYLLLGAVSTFGDAFLLGKILSAACAGVGIRIIGGVLRSLWNPTVAVAGSLFLAANPTLIRYSYRAGTDLVFWVLFAATLALLFAQTRRHYPTWILGGVFAGLAYLTRYNGVALLPMGIVAALVMVRPWKRSAATALTFAATWLAVVSPWLLFLWNQTGDPFWSRNFALVAEGVYGPSPGLANIGQLVNSVGFSSLGDVIRLDPGRFFLAMAANLYRHLWLDIKLLVGPVWAVIGLAGFAVSWRSWWNRRCLAFALVGLIAYAALLPVFYNKRFMLTLLVWWAAGVGGAAGFLADWIQRGISKFFTKAPDRFGWRMVRIVVLVVVAVAAVQASYEGIQRSQGRFGEPTMPVAILDLANEVRESDLVFADNTPIAARKPHIGYYLGAPVHTISSRSNLNDMAGTGMHYLLVSGIESRMFPSLSPMLTDSQPVRDFPGFRFLAASGHWERSGLKQSAALYEVLNPSVWDPAEGAKATPPAPAIPGLDHLDHLRAKLARWYMNWTNDQPLLPLFSLMSPVSRTHPLVREVLGDAYLSARDYAQAEIQYRDLLQESGDPSETLLRLALANHLAGNHSGFDRFMDEYVSNWELDGDPTLEDWINEAATLGRARNYVPAAALIIQFRKTGPDFPAGEDHRMLGYCYLNMRHYGRARESFAKYLQLAPNDPEIMSILQNDLRMTESRP
ncbi:MAG: glycosyltransferase family 39 protein [Candidatus Krumholzibacteriota bacterium]